MPTIQVSHRPVQVITLNTNYLFHKRIVSIVDSRLVAYEILIHVIVCGRVIRPRTPIHHRDMTLLLLKRILFRKGHRLVQRARRSQIIVKHLRIQLPHIQISIFICQTTL